MMAAKQDQVERIKRAVRKAERRTATGAPIGGTGQTIMRLRLSPVGRLIERGDIGAEELRAADEICRVFHSLSGRLLMRSPAYERVDSGRIDLTHRPSYGRDEARYCGWANVWSNEKKKNDDQTLAVIIAAVVDERPLHGLAMDYGRHVRTIRTMIVRGLRDYAARAGWVTGLIRRQWLVEFS